MTQLGDAFRELARLVSRDELIREAVCVSTSNGLTTTKAAWVACTRGHAAEKQIGEAKFDLLCFTKEVSSRHDEDRPSASSRSRVNADGVLPRNGGRARALEACSRGARRITRRLGSSGRRLRGHA
jgi:hypothetical protein